MKTSINSKKYICSDCNKTFQTETNHFGAHFGNCPHCKSNCAKVCVEKEAIEMRRIQHENFPIIKTKLVAFSVGSNYEYSEYKKQYMVKGIKEMEGIGGANVPVQTFVTGEIWLETNCLFDNQWNISDQSPTNANKRCFDWNGDINPRNNSNRIPHGHYLVITDEMREIRSNVKKCGYCGKHHYDSKVFCDSCLGSEYLTENQIHLLRLLPVAESDSKRVKLTDNEKAELLPLYVELQTSAKYEKHVKNHEKRVKDNNDKYNNAIEKAEIEFKGFKWLLDNNINTDNCIYYSHTKVFCFGWRSAMSEMVKKELKIKCKDFPYVIEFDKEKG